MEAKNNEVQKEEVVMSLPAGIDNKLIACQISEFRKYLPTRTSLIHSLTYKLLVSSTTPLCYYKAWLLVAVLLCLVELLYWVCTSAA